MLPRSSAWQACSTAIASLGDLEALPNFQEKQTMLLFVFVENPSQEVRNTFNIRQGNKNW